MSQISKSSQPYRDQRPRPLDIQYTKKEGTLDVVFDNGKNFSFRAEYLRVESPSAEVQGHTLEDKLVVPGKKYVGISDIEQIGQYAIRITFTDGHDTALYSWTYLYELGMNHEERWGQYLKAIKQKNLSRELG